MNPFWIHVVTRTVLRRKTKRHESQKGFSKYELAKGLREFRITGIGYVQDCLLISLGIVSASFGFKGFLLTNRFIDGGATGISLLISMLAGMPLYMLVIVVNIPFIVLSYKIVDRTFAVKTTLAIAGLALCLATVQFPDVTKDNLLVAIFGGFFLGVGKGLAIRGGGVIDGTEVLAIYLSRKFSSTIGDVIIVLNVIIFSVAAYFLSIEIALYSMITYLAALRTLNFIAEGIEEYTGVTIISPDSEEIRQMIINVLGRGVTVYSGKRGFGKTGEAKDIDIIYTVITRFELNKLSTEIEKIDPHAFVIMSSVNDTRGGMIKKRALNRS